jgi:hypothetical protein
MKIKLISFVTLIFITLSIFFIFQQKNKHTSLDTFQEIDSNSNFESKTPTLDFLKVPQKLTDFELKEIENVRNNKDTKPPVLFSFSCFGVTGPTACSG